MILAIDILPAASIKTLWIERFFHKEWWILWFHKDVMFSFYIHIEWLEHLSGGYQVQNAYVGEIWDLLVIFIM